MIHFLSENEWIFKKPIFIMRMSNSISFKALLLTWGIGALGSIPFMAFADTYRALTNRISAFANLPFDSLTRLSLQNRMDEIGKGDPSA